MSFLHLNVFAGCCEERASSGTITLCGAVPANLYKTIMFLQVLHRSVTHFIFFHNAVVAI